MDKSPNTIHVFSQPLEFFRHLVTTAIENQKVEVTQDIEYYLVSLLTQYMEIEKMRRSAQDPLAIQLQKALISGTHERIQLLKELGDFSLYISGFFSDSLNRKLIDIDYYMAMGGVAYNNLSHTVSAMSVLQTTFKDLAQRFGTFVDILAEVSDSAFVHTHRDVLRLYEKWLKTKSERLAELLKKEGLFPLDALTTTVT